MEILIIGIIIFILFIGINIKYFHSEKFKNIQKSFDLKTKEVNSFNNYIFDISQSFKNIKMNEYGQKTNKNICECSLSVLRNAKNAPFKYLCKYFNIEQKQETIDTLNETLNTILTVQEGSLSLREEYNKLLFSLKKEKPFYIYQKFFIKKLGVEDIKLNNIVYPQYCFSYTSPGGKTNDTFIFTFTPENLEKFISYLTENINHKKSAYYQRTLMTKSLREKIKKRDNYTCQLCGNSIYKEPNLLLEIDHIIPISKGGQSVENNLQTLCWKCNRQKGSK